MTEGVFSRVSSNENSAYFVFLMQSSTEDTHADEFEVAEACYFTLAQVQTLSPLRALSQIIVTRVLEGNVKLLEFHPHPDFSPNEFVFYV